jgi:putative DNA methylase
MRDIESNALASSVVLACRPRKESAGATDRRGFIAAMREELPAALKELQQGNIAPVDLAQAAIGPGMAVFSRYAQVAEPDGRPMKVRTALTLINQVLAEVLTEQEGDLDADSRFALKWFEQYGWDEGQYGTAETLAKAMNTSVSGLERSGIFWARAGKARLITPEELPAGYDPSKDTRVPVWEVVLHLVKRLDAEGIDAAARFMAEAGAHLGDLDAVKELAYLLYAICERKKWAKQALRFNNLVTAWSDVDRAARSAPATGPEQGALDFDALTDH